MSADLTPLERQRLRKIAKKKRYIAKKKAVASEHVTTMEKINQEKEEKKLILRKKLMNRLSHNHQNMGKTSDPINSDQEIQRLMADVLGVQNPEQMLQKLRNRNPQVFDRCVSALQSNEQLRHSTSQLSGDIDPPPSF